MPLFDAHFHIVDPRFPLIANDGYLPPPYVVDEYRAATAALDVRGGAVVSASFQGFDQTYLLAALRALGPGFVGVAQLETDAPAASIRALDAAGVRALRFNLFRGGVRDFDGIEAFARRVHDLAGWHAEFYVDGASLAPIAARLAGLPRIVIDHLGMTADALPRVLDLVAGGAKVKATGFGRVSLDVAATLRAIADVDDTALMFGTDLPSTRARRPFEAADVALLRAALGPERAAKAMWSNALGLYRPAGEVA